MSTRTVVSTALLAVTVGSLAISMAYGIASLGQLKDRNRAFTLFVLMGPRSPRSMFTETGWRYRNRAMRARWICFAAFVAWAAMTVLVR